jgi:methyl-accepting chemotaxis protein
MHKFYSADPAAPELRGIWAAFPRDRASDPDDSGGISSATEHAMNWSNLKIGSRLGLGFLVVLLLQVVVALIAWRQMGALADRLHHITSVGHQKVQRLEQITAGMNERAIAARNLVLVRDVAAQRAELERVKQGQSHIDEGVKAYAAVLAEDGAAAGAETERAMLDKLRQLEARYLPIAGAVVELATSAKTAEATQKLTVDCMPLLSQVVAHLGAFQAQLQKQADHEAEEAQAAYTFSKWLLLAVTAGSLVSGVLLAWRLTHSITSPIGQAVQLAERVADGDLSSRILATTRDETGQLLQALKKMNDQLVDIVGRVRTSSDSIATGSAQIATGNADLSQRTETQASNLQETAASMEQLASTVKSNADTARQATQLANGASDVAARGGEVVGQVVATMQDISASSKKIADIIGVIDGIAFQTNILALNAAVEAARAGEQGRGFAVVAGEVRSLAQRSAEAAREIKALIGSSVERVDAGSRLVNDAGSTMNDIVQQVRKVTDLIHEISSATGEQTGGIEQVSSAVTQLDQVTQQNAALVEESAAAAESLKQQAAQLVQAVAVFRLQAA